MSLMNSAHVISVSDDEHEANSVKKDEKIKTHCFVFSMIHYLQRKLRLLEQKKLIHSLKVAIALVLVSFLYLIDPLYKQVGENAMWAIMTVVVLFEFSVGATLSKGLNRFVGTILGGGLGCGAALFAQEVDGAHGSISRAIVVSLTVFIIGAVASYSRVIPNFKRKYDYGAMIFILTSNLVVVSGMRSKKVIELGLERLAMIVIGFVICVFINVLVLPIWASDELHSSIASKFENLAGSIEGNLEEYFKPKDEKDDQTITNFDGYVSVLNSKSKDEILGLFARWEPWHGKFGFSHPWGKYLHIGELLREFAASTISLKQCLQSPRQTSSMPQRLSFKEPCETLGSLLASSLRELGASITEMKRCRSREQIVTKLQSMSNELNLSISFLKLGAMENGDHGLAMTSFVFQLMEMVDKVEELAKEVEELGDVAGFGHSSME